MDRPEDIRSSEVDAQKPFAEEAQPRKKSVDTDLERASEPLLSKPEPERPRSREEEEKLEPSPAKERPESEEKPTIMVNKPETPDAEAVQRHKRDREAKLEQLTRLKEEYEKLSEQRGSNRKPDHLTLEDLGIQRYTPIKHSPPRSQSPQ